MRFLHHRLGVIPVGRRTSVINSHSFIQLSTKKDLYVAHKSRRVASLV